LVLTKRTALALTVIASVLISLMPVVNATLPSSSTPTVPPAMEWDTFYGSKSGLTGSQLIQTSDGGYAIAGNVVVHSYLWGALPPYVWLVKADATGKMEWEQSYDYLYDAAWNQSYDHLYNAAGLVQTSDGGYVMAGNSYIKGDFGISSEGIKLLKTDSNGSVQWSQTYKDSSIAYYDGASSMVQTSDGGLAFAGNTPGQAWIVKLDASGNEEWNQTYPNRSGGGDGWTAYRLIETSDGGLALAGSWKHTSSVNFYFLVKTEPTLPPPTPIPTPSGSSLTPSNSIEVAVDVIVGIVVVVLVGVGLLLYLKKHRH
jgi:hypothetical protein